MSQLILASGSPRRRELLTAAGLRFTVKVSHEEEAYTETEPGLIVMELASLKANRIADTESGDDIIVLGADTVVSVDGRILGKPASPQEAEAMIRSFQGRSHQVYTGVSLVRLREGRRSEKRFFECTDVHVMPLSDEEIRSYVATGEAMDAAGAYKIQGGFGRYVTGFSGDYENVIGLPVKRVLSELRKLIPKEFTMLTF